MMILERNTDRQTEAHRHPCSPPMTPYHHQSLDHYSPIMSRFTNLLPGVSLKEHHCHSPDYSFNYSRSPTSCTSITVSDTDTKNSSNQLPLLHEQQPQRKQPQSQHQEQQHASPKEGLIQLAQRKVEEYDQRQLERAAAREVQDNSSSTCTNAASSSEDEPRYHCSHCTKIFKRRRDLMRHLRTVHSPKKQYGCGLCCSTFTRKDSLKRHKRLSCRASFQPE
ncbi:hypothetical protein BX666DRAFT_1329951 [Dichotomocladium elegans]|nr:hypothetical protein BX666DRAFT_1329951 [Dichotomocladium elegans]